MQSVDVAAGNDTADHRQIYVGRISVAGSAGIRFVRLIDDPTALRLGKNEKTQYSRSNFSLNGQTTVQEIVVGHLARYLSFGSDYYLDVQVFSVEGS